MRVFLSVIILVMLTCCCCNLTWLPRLPQFPALSNPPAAPALPDVPTMNTPTPATGITLVPSQSGTDVPDLQGLNQLEQIKLLLKSSSIEGWSQTVKELSGLDPVVVNGKTFRIKTRLSSKMFRRQSNPTAFDYLLQRVNEWANPNQIEIQEYEVEFGDDSETWKNIIVTFPGQSSPEREILLIAHFDSATYAFENQQPAPGADDNASGTAALLEALKVLQAAPLEKTVKVLFVSGEEYGLLGSEAYAEANNLQHVEAVINLDVISYDPNQDQCVDIHVGSMAKSAKIAEVMKNVIHDYNLTLKPEYLVPDAVDASDHDTFWRRSIAAVMLSANLTDGIESSICEPEEYNPHMHSEEDTFSRIHPPTAYELTKLAVITVLELAGLAPQP